jgi:hypothetical protein
MRSFCDSVTNRLRSSDSDNVFIKNQNISWRFGGNFRREFYYRVSITPRFMPNWPRARLVCDDRKIIYSENASRGGGTKQQRHRINQRLIHGDLENSLGHIRDLLNAHKIIQITFDETKNGSFVQLKWLGLSADVFESRHLRNTKNSTLNVCKSHRKVPRERGKTFCFHRKGKSSEKVKWKIDG